MDDIKKPKKTATAASPQRLVVARRPIIGHDIKKSVPIRDDSDTASEPDTELEPSQSLVPVRHTVLAPIQPPTSQTASEPDKQPDTSADDSVPIPEKTPPIANKPLETTPPAPPAQEKEPPTPAPTPTPSTPVEPPAGTPAAPDDATESTADSASSKESAETRKAVEAAAKELKREQELEKLIEARKFNVPIKTGAHKRSIKVSFGLTFLIFLLAIMLIDLMLDSDTILLLQKIPHTHFFTTSN